MFIIIEDHTEWPEDGIKTVYGPYTTKEKADEVIIQFNIEYGYVFKLTHKEKANSI